MFKEFFHGANDYVNMNGELDRSMLVDLGQRRRRWVLTAVALLMALFVLAPWVASDPAAFGWLSRVAPPVAQFLRPNGGSTEEKGIRMEVAGVTREGDALLIHLTVEDLEGGRLSAGTYPEHWYYTQGRGSAGGHCVPYYDGQTGLLHLNLRCEPEQNLQEFDWDRWVTVTIETLLTRTDQSGVQTIEGLWSIQVSPLTEA